MLYGRMQEMVKKATDVQQLVVNVRTHKCDVLVGGPKSKWALPAYLKRASQHEKKYDVMMAYKIYLERRMKDNPNFKENLKKQLRGKILGCFCEKGTLCHANVLVEIANEKESS